MSNVIDSRGDGQLCRNCHYWVPGHGGGAIGECRRYAPKPHNTGLALRRRDRSDATEGNAASWPETHRTEWCGEWEAKKAAVPTDGQAEQPAGASGLREVRFDLVAAEDAIADAYQATGDYSAGLVAVVMESVLTRIGMRYEQIQVGSKRKTITAVLREPIGGDACTGG